MNTLKSFVAVVVGILAGGFVTIAINGISQKFWPSGDIDLTSREHIQIYIDSLPLAALLFIPLACFLGATTGGLMAAKLSSDKPYVHALRVVILMSLGGIAMLMLISYPTIIMITSLLSFPLAAHFIKIKLENQT